MVDLKEQRPLRCEIFFDQCRSCLLHTCERIACTNCPSCNLKAGPYDNACMCENPASDRELLREKCDYFVEDGR